MPSPIQPAKAHFVDANGNALVGGQVYTYAPGGTTPKTTYQDYAGQTANPNPTPLDARGECVMLGIGSYRQVVQDVNGAVIWDQVTGNPELTDLVDNSNAGTPAAFGYINVTGAITVPTQATTDSSTNAASTAYVKNIIAAGGTPPGPTNPLQINSGGTGSTTQAAALAALLGTSAVPIANGGTGQTTASAALTALLQGAALSVSNGGTGMTSIPNSVGRPGWFYVAGTSLIVQFGLGGTIGPSSGGTISFGMSFPNGCLTVIGGGVSTSLCTGGAITTSSPTAANFTLFNGTTSTIVATYIAVGY